MGVDFVGGGGGAGAHNGGGGEEARHITNGAQHIQPDFRWPTPRSGDPTAFMFSILINSAEPLHDHRKIVQNRLRQLG